MRVLLLAAALLTVAACDSNQPPPMSVDEINQLITIADSAIVVAQKMRTDAPAAEIEQGTQILTDSLDHANGLINHILKHVSAGRYMGRFSIEPTDVSACIRAHVINLYDALQMSSSALPFWVQGLTMCAINANVYFESVPGDDGAAVALAIGIVDPIAAAAAAKAGLKSGAQLQEYQSANQRIIERFGPKCAGKKRSSPTEPVRFRCAGYEVAMAMQPKLVAILKVPVPQNPPEP